MYVLTYGLNHIFYINMDFNDLVKRIIGNMEDIHYLL